MDITGRASEEPAPQTVDELLVWIGTQVPPWPSTLRTAWKVALAIKPELEPGDIGLVESALSELTGLPLRVVSQYRLDEQNRDATGAVLHSSERAAQAYLKELKGLYPAVVWTEGSLYVYDQEARYFLKIARAVLEKQIAGWLNGKPVAKGLRDVREICDRVVSELDGPDHFDDAPAGINFANGFAKWDVTTNRLKLEPHGPERKARFVLPVAYERGASAPVFVAGMKRLFPDELTRDAVGEMFAAILFGLRPEKDGARNMFILHGPPRSGKSTILDMLGEFFPEDVKTSVSPASFGNAYSLRRLAGALLNTCTELPSRLANAERLKQVVAQEMISARHPHERELQFRCKARHVVACNELPLISDKTNAFARRVLVIPTGRSLDRAEVDGNFLEHARKEMAGIIEWAAEAGRRLMQKQAFTLPPDHEDGLAVLQCGSDLAAKFVRTQVMAVRGGRLTSVELQAALHRYYAAHEQKVVSIAATMKRVAGLMAQLYGAKRADTNNNPYYEGVGWRSGPETSSTSLLGGDGGGGGAGEVAVDRPLDPELEDL